MLKNKLHAHQKGFNLLEILVVLVIVGIVLGVVYPAGQYFIERQRQTTELNHLLVTLERARQEAAQRQRPVRLCGSQCPNFNTNEWQILLGLNIAQPIDANRILYQRSVGNRFPAQASGDVVLMPPPQRAQQEVYLGVETGFSRVRPRVVVLSPTGQSRVISCSEAETTLSLCNRP